MFFFFFSRHRDRNRCHSSPIGESLLFRLGENNGNAEEEEESVIRPETIIELIVAVSKSINWINFWLYFVYHA